ncbi:hypothetical protein KI387_044506, partial [Taxus chinensis]
LVSVIVMGVFNLEKRKQGGEFVEYQSQGWLRECAVWDADNRRFLVSFLEGGLGEIVETGKEETLVKDPDYAGNASLGFRIDPPRNRIVVAVVDAHGYKYSALAAYDMATWQRLFLTQLGDAVIPSLANDVAVDVDGNAYVTDSVGNRIWKVGPGGAPLAVFSSPVFSSVPPKVPFTTVGLNGIVYHPGGYLLVVHTWAGVLFKVSLDGVHVSRVDMRSASLRLRTCT